MRRHPLLVLALAFAVAAQARAAEVSSRLSLVAANEDVEEHEFGTSSLGSLGVLEELGGGLVLDAELYGYLVGGTGSLRYVDGGSYVRLGWTPAGWGQREGLALTLLPLNCRSRLRLGYEQPASWSEGGQSGAELRLNRERWYAYAAANSESRHEALAQGTVGLWTWMAGAGGDLFSRVWLEAVGVVSDRGLLPSATSLKDRSRMGGVSGRALFHHGAPIGPSVDFSLLSTLPDAFARSTDRESYPGGMAATVSLEASHLAESLGKPGTDGATVVQHSNLFNLVARLKRGALRLHALGLYRSASFSYPSQPYLQALPEGTEAHPELLAKAGADYHFASTGLTPGLVLGLSRPSSLSEPGASFTTVRRDARTYASMPNDKEVQPVFSTQLTLRWDWGEKLSALGEVSWAHDENRYELDSAGTHLEALPGDFLGVHVLLQVRL